MHRPSDHHVIARELLAVVAFALGLAPAAAAQSREVRDITTRVTAAAPPGAGGEVYVEGETLTRVTIVTPGRYRVASPRIELIGSEGATVEQILLTIDGQTVVDEAYEEELGPGVPAAGWSRREKQWVKELGELHTWADKTRERAVETALFDFARGERVDVVCRVRGWVRVDDSDDSGPITPGSITATVRARLTMEDLPPARRRSGGGGGGLPGPSGAPPIEPIRTTSQGSPPAGAGAG